MSSDWNLYLMHGAVRAADNGVKALPVVSAEKVYREFKLRNDPKVFDYTTGSGKVVQVHVHEGKKCPFPPS